MLEAGIFEEGEPVELLHGLLVSKDRGAAMVVSPRHRLAVHRFLQLISQLDEFGCHLQLQSPLTIQPSHEPEPDAMIVRGRIDDYARDHPGPADVTCVIEVSETSLLIDLGPKLRIYAAAGIAQYVVIDLTRDQVILHENPDSKETAYKQVTTLLADDDLPLILRDNRRLTIAVSACIP